MLHRTQINFTVAIDFTASNGKISLALIVVIIFDVLTEKDNWQHSYLPYLSKASKATVDKGLFVFRRPQKRQFSALHKPL